MNNAIIGLLQETGAATQANGGGPNPYLFGGLAFGILVFLLVVTLQFDRER
jgi:hypothetical protein